MLLIYVILVAISIILYLNRPVDLLTLGLFSSYIYFLPAFFWYESLPMEAYTIYVITLVFFVIAGVLASKTVMLRQCDRVQVFSNYSFLFYLLWFLTSVFGLLDLLIHGWSFDLSKIDSTRGDVISYSWSVFLGYFFVLSLLTKNRVGFVFGAINYSIIVALGDRTQVVVMLLVAILCFVGYRKDTLYDALKKIGLKGTFLLVLVGFVGVFGKEFYGAIQMANGFSDFFFVFQERIFGFAFQSSFEPFHVQTILRLTVDTGLAIDYEYLLRAPLQMLPFATEFGGDVHYQSNIVKNFFFSDWREESGVSSNFFAEGYMVFGMLGGIMFSFIYVSLIYIINAGVFKANGFWRIVLLFAGVFLAFYLHRSSVYQLIGHEKRIFYSGVFVIIVCRLFSARNQLGRQVL